MKHYPHCAYGPIPGTPCIMIHTNIQHSCCSPDLPPGTELLDEPTIVTSPAIPGHLAQLPAEVEPRGIEPRDFQDYRPPRVVEQMQTRNFNLLQTNAALQSYREELRSQVNYQLLQGTGIAAASTSHEVSMPATNHYGVDGPAGLSEPYQSSLQLNPALPETDVFYQLPVSGGHLPNNEYSSMAWMPEFYEADGLPNKPRPTNPPYTSAP